MSPAGGDGTPLTAQGAVQGTQVGSYQLPLLGMFRVESVVAQIDGTAAATTPTLTVLDKSGAVIAKKRQTQQIPVGDTGDATWALRLADEQVATPGGGSYVFVDEQQFVGDQLTFANIPQDGRHLVMFLEALSGATPIMQFNGDGGLHYRTIRNVVQDLNGTVTNTSSSTVPANFGIYLIGAESGTSPSLSTITIPYYALPSTFGFGVRSALIDIATFDRNPVAGVNLIRRTNTAGFWDNGGPPPAPAVTDIHFFAGAGIGGRASLYKIV